MKHVRESLSQFNDYKFFRLFEDDDKAKLQDKEKDGLAVIDKITKNFDDFKKDAKGEILKYKEFWEENQKAKEAVSDTGSVYKLYDSDYVVGVFELPAETLSDGSIEGGLGATDEPEEEIIEGKEIGAESKPFMEEHTVNEVEGDEEELDLDLDLNEPTPEEKPTDPTVNQPVEEPVSDTDAAPETKPIDEPIEKPAEQSADLTAPQTYFVVYDMGADEREEILRTGSNNVVNAFNAFYNDIFKGTMKSIILQYKEQKETEKAEVEKKEKEKTQTDKESKLKKFLGNSSTEKKENKPEEKKEEKKTNESLKESLTPGTFRAIEGALENEFCDDDGNVDASYEISYKFLQEEGFPEEDIKEYLSEYFDENEQPLDESLNEYHIPYEETKHGENYIMAVVDSLQSEGLTFEEADNMVSIEYELVGDCYANSLNADKCAIAIIKKMMIV